MTARSVGLVDLMAKENRGEVRDSFSLVPFFTHWELVHKYFSFSLLE